MRAAPWSSAGLHLNNAKHFITRVNELQGQATTLEVSTVVVLHSRIDEARQAAWPARQAAWPGRRGCTPRPSQPSQLRRRLTTRLVGSRIALRKTEIPPGILNPVRTRRGLDKQDADGTRLVPRWSPSRNPKKPGNPRSAPASAIKSLRRTVHFEVDRSIPTSPRDAQVRAWGGGLARPRRARARWLGEGSPGECPLCVEQTGPMSSPAQPEWRNKRAQASGRYGKRPGAFGFSCPLCVWGGGSTRSSRLPLGTGGCVWVAAGPGGAVVG